MRVFIAIDINERIRKALGDLQERIRGDCDFKKGEVKWVRPEAIHLTLKFLGEIEDTKAVEVCNIVKSAALEHESFDLDIEGVGSFGGKNARVLWVGTGSGSDKLCRLAEDIEERFTSAGWGRES